MVKRNWREDLVLATIPPGLIDWRCYREEMQEALKFWLRRAMLFKGALRKQTKRLLMAQSSLRARELLLQLREIREQEKEQEKQEKVERRSATNKMSNWQERRDTATQSTTNILHYRPRNEKETEEFKQRLYKYVDGKNAVIVVCFDPEEEKTHISFILPQKWMGRVFLQGLLFEALRMIESLAPEVRES